MYRGYFLNLERNEQRRNSLLRNLAEVGATARYDRWEAVDGRAAAKDHPTKLDPGNLGLWLSHERLLQSAPSDKHIHILEDDAVLGQNAVAVLDGMLAHLETSLPTWDLMFTDTFVPPRTDVFVMFLQNMREYAQTGSFAVVDLANIPFACTTSMLINKSSIQKYLALLSGNWSQGRPIDLFIRDLVSKRKLRAHVVLPFVTTISAESNNSDIRGDMDRSRRVCDMLRRGLFQDANLEALLTEIRQLTTGAKIEPLVNLYLNAETFMLSDQWQKF